MIRVVSMAAEHADYKRDGASMQADQLRSRQALTILAGYNISAADLSTIATRRRVRRLGRLPAAGSDCALHLVPLPEFRRMISGEHITRSSRMLLIGWHASEPARRRSCMRRWG